SRAPEQITDRENFAQACDLSKSGTVVYTEQHTTTGWDLWTIPIDGHGPPKVFAASTFNEMQGRFSPDDRWIAYSANESGRYEIYVQPYPGPGKKLAISSEGGRDPRWSPRGNELFFRNG